MNHPACKLSLIALACAVLTACGGGGDDTTGTTATTGTTTTGTTTTGTTGTTTTGTTTTGTTGTTGTSTGTTGTTTTGTTGTTTTPTGTTVAATDITQANFEAVASLAASTVDMVASLVVLPDDLVAQVSSAAAPRAKAASMLFGAVQRASASTSTLERAQAVTASSNPLVCNSGSSTVSVNDANGNGVRDAGDIVTITDTNCERDGDTTTGQITITLNATTTGTVAENSTGYTVDVNFSATNYKIVFSDGSSNLITGKARLKGSRTAYHTGRDELTIDTWTVTHTGASSSQSASLTGYSGIFNYTPTEYTLTISGDVSSAALNNVRYTVSTQTPFAFFDYSAIYPFVGQAKATAPSGNSVSVKALSSVQASISPDLNADGTADTGLTVTPAWSDLY